MPRDQTHRYRLRIFDGNYEVLHKRTVVVELDLTSPVTDGVLDRHLINLTRAARIYDNEPMDHPRLEVRDAVTNQKVRDVL